MDLSFPCPDCKWIREGIEDLKEKHDKCQTQRVLEYNMLSAQIQARADWEEVNKVKEKLQEHPTYGFIKLLVGVLIVIFGAHFVLLTNISTKVDAITERISYYEGVLNQDKHIKKGGDKNGNK